MLVVESEIEIKQFQEHQKTENFFGWMVTDDL